MLIYKEKLPARKRIGANPEGESGPGGPPSDHRERVRCGELKKGTGSAPAWVQKKEGQNLSFFCTLKDTCFRTKHIEELDVLCRLAARFKHYYEKPALTEDAF